MATRRETDDADAPGIDAPLASSAAHQADGALRILKRAPGRFAFGFIGTARHAVFQDNACDANGIEPGSDFFAFELPKKVPIAAAGADQDRRSAVLVLKRSMEGD